MKIIIAEQTASGCVNHEYTIGSKIMFDGLNKECDSSTQYYCTGDDKKKVSTRKFRALSTIVNQTQTAINETGARNGRELAFWLAFKIVESLLPGIRITIDMSDEIKKMIVLMLLGILLVDGHLEMRRQRTRTRTNTNVELIARTRARTRGRDIPFAV